MTNAELQAAIEYTSQRVREVGTIEPQYKMLNEHLQLLLSEQARRALDEAPAYGPNEPETGA